MIIRKTEEIEKLRIRKKSVNIYEYLKRTLLKFVLMSLMRT